MSCAITGATHGLTNYQTTEAKRARSPDHPLRFSPTISWTLSTDYNLAPVPELAIEAHARRVDATNLSGTGVEDEVIYET